MLGRDLLEGGYMVQRALLHILQRLWDQREGRGLRLDRAACASGRHVGGSAAAAAAAAAAAVVVGTWLGSLDDKLNGSLERL